MGRIWCLFWKPGKLRISGKDAYGESVSYELDALLPTRLGSFFWCRPRFSYPVFPWRRKKRARGVTSVRCE